MRPSTRRHFLMWSTAAGGTWLIGARMLAAEGAGDDSVLPAALERMRAQKAFGIALVVPDQKPQRKRLGKQLEELVQAFELRLGNEGPWDYRSASELAVRMQECVWFCVSPGEIEAEKGESLVLVDGTGKRLAGLDFRGLHEPEEILVALRELMDGDGRSEQRDRLHDVGALEKRLRGEEGARLQEVIAEEWTKSPAAMAAVYRNTSEFAVRESIGGFALSVLRFSGELAEERPLVAGVQWDRGQTYDPCPGCGLMSSPGVERKFASFFQKKR